MFQLYNQFIQSNQTSFILLCLIFIFILLSFIMFKNTFTYRKIMFRLTIVILLIGVVYLNITNINKLYNSVDDFKIQSNLLYSYAFTFFIVILAIYILFNLAT